MRVLITGITGFAGSHLAEFLIDEGHQVFGTKRVRSSLENLEKVLNRVHLIDCELTDASATRAVLSEVKPELIFHLAAQSFVPASWKYPAYTLFNNLGSELSILEGVRELGIDARIHIAGSSEEYGYVDEKDLPITEDTPLRPLSPYGVSKVAQDLLGYQYFKSYGMYIVRTRAFNHTGPRRGVVFATSNFAKQIAEIELGLREPVIEVGNLSASRDFTDVRDVVRAYFLALVEGRPGEVYNVCSGKSYTMKEVLELMLSISGCKAEVKVDQARLRPSDVPHLKGDYGKIKAEIGWAPRIPFETTLLDLLNYWRGKLSTSRGF